MRIAFAGTPQFAACALGRLIDADETLVAVLTQPDRPSGRGRRLTPSPVKLLAQTVSIPVRQPTTLHEMVETDFLRSLALDIMVVAAYGLILPQRILDLPRLGCINIHASLLPRWRGAAPIQRAIEAGDTASGISIMQMDAGLDTGPVLISQSVPIRSSDTAGSLHDRLADLGANLIVETLRRMRSGSLLARPQDESRATYAAKLDKLEARIDWSDNAVEIERRVRAFNPWPVAYTTLGTDNREKDRLRILRAKALQAPVADARPGQILSIGSAGIEIACGIGTLLLLEVQAAGRKPMSSSIFVRAARLEPGMHLL